MEEVSQLEDALTSSDGALIALKAVLVYEINRLDALTPDVERFEFDLEAFVADVAELDDTPLTPAEGMALARQFASWAKPLGKIDRALNRVSDTATKSIVAHKVRAETKAKLAEVEGIAAFVTLNRTHRAIFHALAPDDGLIAAYESALQREIYGPNRLELPPVDPKVLTYPVEKLEPPNITPAVTEP